MEVLSEDSQGLKIPPLNVQEPPKKKKQSRKKPEAKPSKPEFEAPEVVPDLNNDLDSDLVVYTYKLESELASAKKKLKSQRQKFRQLIHSLAKNMDAKGITANIVQDYLQTLGPRLADIETESNYEKFFTTHKYRILEDSTGQIVDQPISKEGSSKKTASKSALKTSTASDKVSTNGDLLHTSDDGQQTSTKKPKKEAKEPKEPKEPKAQKTSGDTTTTEGKKKKTKKHKESDDNINMGEPDLEILEIPPPKAKPKKEDAVKQDDNRQKTTIPPMPQQQQPQQPAPAQMNNMLEGFQSLMQQVDPSALMNAYLMAGAGQIPGMSESDIALYMGKTFQDMMKMGGGHNAHNAMRGNEQGGNDMMNYYQRNFQ